MTPRRAEPEARDITARVQTALYRRCRRGEPEALAALLYSLVDRLYTAASYVLPDETSAVTTVAETWHDLLDLLQAPVVWGHLRQRAFQLLEYKLAIQVPEAEARRVTVRKALQRAQREEEAGLLAFPAADLQVLVDAVPWRAICIAEATQRHRARFQQTVLAVTAFVVAVIGYNLWLGASARNAASLTQFLCLQDRVVHHDLVAAVRDSVDELSDPEGADRYEARLLQEVGLVLEELANAQSQRGNQVLDFLSRRVKQAGLSQDLAELMEVREGMARKELSQAQLVLEEVANL